MSGDVQPRKRKDKKKRKDEEGEAYSPLISNEEVTIHVHKEGGTGGNICAKIVFFFLFSALIVVIGLIIKENQGLNELEHIEEESRFSHVFEGWVDKISVGRDEEDESPEIIQDHDLEEDDSNHYESDEQNLEDIEESQEIDEDSNQEYSEQISEEDNEDIEVDEEILEEDEEIVESDEDNTVEEGVNYSTKESDYQSQENGKDVSEEQENMSEVDDNEDDGIAKSKEQSKEKIKSDKDSQEKEASEESTPVFEEHKSEEKEEKAYKVEPDSDKKEKNEPQEIIEDNKKEDFAQESSNNVNIRPDGEEVESDSDKASEGDAEYEHSNITNKDDYKIKADIDAAEKHLQKNAAYANRLFEALLDKNPLSPRSLYGKAKALDILAEQRKSNELLQQALNYYLRALNVPDVPDLLYVTVAERYVDRARFMGLYKQAVAVHWLLIDKFQNNASYLNNLAVTYLTINLVEEARSVLKRVLSRWPNDGFALVHYGFILKTVDNNLEDAITYLSKGLKTKAPGVIDGRFYFHLGDALARLDRSLEAMKVYEEGVQEKVFMSKYQRSLYNVPRLTAKPWWEPNEIPLYRKLILALKEKWEEIRKEGLTVLNTQGYFQDEAENLKDTGTWKQFELFARGQKSAKNCAKCPVTCNIIQDFPEASGCRRGQSKFSVMHPKTHVWPHCGPTNCRLRIHLGLKIPQNTFIRVAEKTRSWKEGDVIIFDDSFEHEVWHNGSDFRLVLIVDVWHPDLSASEKNSLTSI